MRILILLTSFVWAFACSDSSDRSLPGHDSERSGAKTGADAVPDDGDVGSNDDDSNSSENQIGLDVTFAENVGPTIQNACLGCHNATGAAAFLPLDSKQLLEAQIGDDTSPATNNFFGRMADDTNPMPPGADRATRDSLMKLLENWKNNDFL